MHSCEGPNPPTPFPGREGGEEMSPLPASGRGRGWGYSFSRKGNEPQARSVALLACGSAVWHAIAGRRSTNAARIDTGRLNAATRHTLALNATRLRVEVVVDWNRLGRNGQWTV